MTSLGGTPYYILEFGDELVYFTPYTVSLFLLALVFTVFAILAKPERQVDIAFGGDAYATKDISVPELRFRRFMAIACGCAAMGAMVTGDVFNFTLFISLVGICNVGIVAAVKNRHVQNAAFQYGIVALAATVPLFGGAAILGAIVIALLANYALAWAACRSPQVAPHLPDALRGYAGNALRTLCG